MFHVPLIRELGFFGGEKLRVLFIKSKSRKNWQ